MCCKEMGALSEAMLETEVCRRCCVLHVPDLRLVVAGDTIYNGVQQYLGESADGGRDAWQKY
jgi:hypothetical protein